MNSLPLTLAIGDYDHVRDLLTGRVRAEGINILPINLPVEEIFYRFTRFQEWHISEMSFAKYASLRSQGSDAMFAIPVFPSRVFRHSSIYVRADSGIEKPQDLAGKRVGLPEWAQTAAIYTRGYLMHSVGIPLKDIQWFQAGVNEPGRVEKVSLQLPPGVTCTPMPNNSLNELLLAGELDVVMSARPPKSYSQGDRRVVRLFDDYVDVEQAYWRETGIFPIMHVVALRRDVVESHPWVAMNLFKAFTEAKDRSVARALDLTCSHFPIPWGVDYTQKSQSVFGQDIWPYGIESNRATLDAFLRFAHEQGVCHRRMTPEEIFVKEVQSSFKV